MIPLGGQDRPWDRLVETESSPSAVPISAAGESTGALAPSSPVLSPASRLACVGAAWADLVSVVAVLTGCLLAAAIHGGAVGPGAVPWAVVAASSWWIVSSVISLRVSGATLGMAMVGTTFAQPVRGWRLPAVVTASAVTSALLGLPNLVGAVGNPGAVAAGQKTVALGPNAVTRGDV